MNIPRFWANVSKKVEAPDGTMLPLKCWGWSHSDRREAESRASDTLRRLVARIVQGEVLTSRYLYGSRALREEILQEIPGTDDEPAAIITRNSYGSLVLNTGRVMFVDVDAPEPTIGKRLSRWFGRSGGAKDETLSVLRERLQSRRGSFRIYRTAAGFRVLAKDRLYEPGSSESEEIMNSLGADPAFVQLCKLQKSFRARLTPKPWRCSYSVPPNSFPRETDKQQQAFERWKTGYESAIRETATCEFVEEVGSSFIHQEVNVILPLHDEFTKSTSGLWLA